MADQECDCTPGSAENGWHESRGQGCLEREMSSWSRLSAIATGFSRPGREGVAR